MTIKLGVIGTNWITNEFVDAAIASGKYTLTGVYSRTIEKAKTFGEPYGAAIYETDITTFAESDNIDVVYVASPNSLHFEHTMELVKGGKHVIVEKPMFSNPTEWQEAHKAAEENHVLLFEAARHIHEENFMIVKDELSRMKDISGASLTYMKYSSRYDNVLDGEEPNIFSLDFSGGALADLGVYIVYAAVAWFGMPESSHYFAKKIRTGVDGKGTIILRYPDFDITMQTGKIANSYATSEIYGLNKTLILDGVTTISSVEIVDNKTQLKEQIAHPAAETPMLEEAEAFAAVIKDPESGASRAAYEEWTALSRDVNQIMYDLRQDAGIIFKADKNK
ncbi:MAG: Gfo/Idh/MocA family oxidoreductase [Pisciglobus halotolerans]|nr:Gfo/Idh/MocA family oxidoreductase [Pisciglobus halotolerans]